MHKIIFTLLIFIPLVTTAQDENSLDEQINNMTSSIEYHKLEFVRHKAIMDSLVIHKSSLVNRKKLLNYSLSDRYRVPTKTIMKAKLREEPSIFSQHYATIPAERDIWIVGYSNDFYMVEYKEFIGYVSTVFVKEKESVLALKGVLSEVEKKLLIEKDKAYLDSLVQFYESQEQRYSGEVRLGMDGYDVTAEMGPPERRTKSETLSGTVEYLHYTDKLIVVRNGVVTRIQDNY